MKEERLEGFSILEVFDELRKCKGRFVYITEKREGNMVNVS